MQTTPDALSIALDIGESMLRSGADVRRVEDTVTRILHAYGYETAEVFSIVFLILATVGHGEGRRTECRRVSSYSTNLSRLEALNDLSRRICRQTPPPEVVAQEIAAIHAPPARRVRTLVAASYLLGAGAFCIFFGGSLPDALVAAGIALFLGLADRFLLPRFPNRFVYTLLTAALMGLAAAGLGRLFPALHADKIMIGDIMLQIPGLLLINGLREMLLGDTITGLLRIVDALLTALAIAAGFACALLLFPVPVTVRAASDAARILSAACGTLSFSVIFGVRRRRLIPAVIAGTLTISIYLLCSHFWTSALACFTVASVAGGAYAELAARVLRAPVTVFLIPSLIPPLPGSDLYYTMASLVSGRSADFILYGQRLVYAAIGIATGVLFSSLLVVVFQHVVHKKA